MFKRSFLKKISIIFMSFSLMAMTFGCSTKDSEFPDIPTPTSTEITVLETNTSDVFEKENYKLSFALPYSEETVNYLFKYYYAKTNGMISEEENGSNISLDYLDSINIPYAIETIYVPDTGASIASIFDSTERAPDLFLTNELDKCIENDLCASLNEYCSTNSLIDSNSTYVSPVMACTSDENLYAIPHYMSIPLIYGNVDFLPNGSNQSFKISLSDLSSLISSVHENNSDDVVCFTAAKDLIPFIASSFDNDNGYVRSYLLNDEFIAGDENAQQIFEDTCSYVFELYDDGLSFDFNEDGSVPTYSRNAALWVANSSDLIKMLSYYPNKLCFMQIPAFSDSDETIPYVTVYPICVSSKSDSKRIAADFATFISMDPDALCLINRLEKKIGMFPVVSNSVVWDYLIEDEQFGYIASVYENEMDKAICSLEVINSATSDKADKKISNYFNSDSEESVALVDIYGGQ